MPHVRAQRRSSSPAQKSSISSLKTSYVSSPSPLKHFGSSVGDSVESRHVGGWRGAVVARAFASPVLTSSAQKFGKISTNTAQLVAASPQFGSGELGIGEHVGSNVGGECVGANVGGALGDAVGQLLHVLSHALLSTSSAQKLSNRDTKVRQFGDTSSQLGSGGVVVCSCVG